MAKGLLVRAKYPVDGRQVSVWGLTPHGVAFSFDEDEPLTDVIPFSAVKGVGGAAAAPAGRAVPAPLHGGPGGHRLAVPAPYGPERDESAGRAGGAGRQNGGI